VANRIVAVQVSDTTEDDSSTTADNKKYSFAIEIGVKNLLTTLQDVQT